MLLLYELFMRDRKSVRTRRTFSGALHVPERKRFFRTRSRAVTNFSAINGLTAGLILMTVILALVVLLSICVLASMSRSQTYELLSYFDFN